MPEDQVPEEDHDGGSLEQPSVTVVAALGTSQTLAWASSYYLPAILAEPIGVAMGIPRSWVFAAFSFSLLVAAIAGPQVGRTIDRRGGRGVLVLSNVVLAGGLIALAAATGPAGLFGAWAVLGIGMALGLYDAGFATLTALYGRNSRSAITGITLFAGFASTLSWPVSSFLNDAMGWRQTCLVWATLNLVLGLPLNRFLLPLPMRSAHRPHAAVVSVGWKPRREMLLVAFVFAAAWFVTGSMAAHLPRLLEMAGATPFAAITAAALVGPAQVVARTLAGRRADPRIRGPAAGPSAGLRKNRRHTSSDRRGCAASPGSIRCRGLCGALWRRQRPSDHCPGHGSACDLWALRLWGADRAARSTCPCRPSLRPVRIWRLA